MTEFGIGFLQHTGAASLDQIFYSYTTDFVTFTTAQPYIAISGVPVIDLTFLPLGGTSYARFIKNENALRVWEERSTTGLFGTWTRVGSSTTWISNVVSEGPLTFQNNQVAGLVHTFVDEYGGDSTAFVSQPFVLRIWNIFTEHIYRSNRAMCRTKPRISILDPGQNLR